jgi:hypothetical protein
MGSVNAINPAVDQTVRVFDDFYGYSQQVDANEFDAVNSYFVSVFNDRQIARSFTTTFFRISEKTQVPVLELLQQVEGQDQVQLTSTICYYLNGERSPATLLGINATVTPTVWAARNVLP